MTENTQFPGFIFPQVVQRVTLAIGEVWDNKSAVDSILSTSLPTITKIGRCALKLVCNIGVVFETMYTAVYS